MNLVRGLELLAISRVLLCYHHHVHLILSYMISALGCMERCKCFTINMMIVTLH
jgi:hypothetical protein